MEIHIARGIFLIEMERNCHQEKEFGPQLLHLRQPNVHRQYYKSVDMLFGTKAPAQRSPSEDFEANQNGPVAIYIQ